LKPEELQSFLIRLIRRLLFSGIIIIPLAGAALSEGTGYHILNISYNKTLLRLGPYIDLSPPPGDYARSPACGTVLYWCSVNVSLNPIFYPLSHLFQEETQSNMYTVVIMGPILATSEHDVNETTILTAVSGEFLRNIPYLLIVAFIIETLLEGIFSRIRVKLKMVSPDGWSPK